MEFKSFFDMDTILNGLAWNESENVYGQMYGWTVNYLSDNLLPHDILYLNSLKKGQFNLYEEFITKSFFARLENIIGSKSISKAILPVFNLYEDEKGDKHLVYDLNIYISAILNAKMITSVPSELLSYNENMEEKVNTFREIMREERRKLNDVLTKKTKSEYYGKFIEIYNEEIKKFNGKVNGISLTMDNLLNSKISFCQKMIIACRYLKDFFKKEIKIDELMSSFDYDKFCLVLCYSMMKQSVSSKNEITSSINYCMNYFKAYEEYKKINPKYNPYIVIYNSEQANYEKVSAEQLFAKFKSIINSHPEFHSYNLGEESINYGELSDYVLNTDEKVLNKKELTSLLRMLLSKQNYESVSNDEITQNIVNLNRIDKSNISLQERNRIQQQIEKMEFLLKREPVKIIRGKGTFSNYYGYVYSNGYIVFDTLDKDFNKSYGNAMFVMPYEKMESFLNITKSELRANHKGIITPIDHRGNWKERIEQFLDSKDDIDMSDSIIDTIDLSRIIDLEQLEKLKKIHADLTKEENDKIEQRKTYIKKMLAVDDELRLEANSELSETEFNSEIEEAILNGKSFIELFAYWKQKHQGIKVKRNPIVAAITKNRARDSEGNYCCELCGAKNFESSSFDSHHVISLANGGIDNIYNTICLCPNCHRYVHSGKMTLYQQYELLNKIRLHISKDNPEYLKKFDEMISPIAENDEYYQTHKEEIDHNFSVLWNGENHKLR